MKYTTMLFDLDDTLLDTIANAKETLEEIYNDYNIKQYYSSYADFADVYFVNNNRLWELYSLGKIEKSTLLKERFLYPFQNFEEVSEEMIAKMSDDFINRVKHKSTLIDGAIEILDYLKAKYKMHILSNGFTEIQYIKMKSAGLDNYFDKIILSDAVGVNKPHPDIFAHALRETGAKKEETMMIGDNLISDIGGAINSGIDQIWFNPEGKDSDGLKPLHTISELYEIKNIL